MFKTYEFNRCRAYGHAWFEVAGDWNPVLGDSLTLVCERCGTERRDTVRRDDRTLYSRNYIYPDGYSLKFGGEDDRPRRIDFTLNVIDEGRPEKKRRATRRR